MDLSRDNLRDVDPDTGALPTRWAESERFVPRAFVQPTLAFLRTEASGGIIMLLAAIVAVVWANSPWGDSYFAIAETKIEIAFGSFHFHHLSELTVQKWVNDALMVIFFFVVGLEIKRELVVGELNDVKSAALPAVAALGGMVLPASIYLLFNAGGEFSQGWGIPMATDIAFAVGVVSMAGRRVPVGAKLFLLALAIVDDLGAILVIAIFYTDELAFGWLAAAAVGLALVAVMQRVNIRSLPAYIVVGVFVWLAVLESGVHATVAGVALALLTPLRPFYDPRRFADRADGLVRKADRYIPAEGSMVEMGHHESERLQGVMADLQRLSRESIPPLERLEHRLSPWSSFVVVPLFALANAGVRISGDAVSQFFSDPVILGIFFGLVVGKAVGVAGFAWIAVRLGWGRLPHMTTWRHVIGLGLLAGIGFTVALFVAALSFEPGSAAAGNAKIGIFAASIVAGLAGFAFLRSSPSREELDANHDGVLDERQEREAVAHV